MTDANNNRGGATEPPAPEAGEAGGQPNILGSILNWLLIFFLVQNATELAKTKFMPPRDADTAASPLSDPVGVSSDTGAAAAERQQHQQLKPKGVTSDRGGPVKPKPKCLWDVGTTMDLDVIITDSPGSPEGWELTTPVGDDATGV
ncbi:hypothetical protein THAOC_00145, partial [Thalassiosira oceanica]